jgi:DNA-binding LytR/AlgR family response regulator
LTNRELTIENKDKTIRWDRNKIKTDSVLIVVIASVLALLTPFGMDNVGMLHGWTFWLVLCFSGYFIYSPIIYFGNDHLQKQPSVIFSKYWCRIVFLAAIASVIMSFVVPFVVILFFDIPAPYLSLVPQMMLRTFIMGGLISFIHTLKNHFQLQKQQLLQQQKQLAEQQKTSVETTNKKFNEFMAKLPIDKRGQLLCLEMDDHYLKVHTDQGHHLLLMRFKDALEFLVDYPGMQTHRSWWVAKDAVVGEEKVGRKLSLKLVNQQLVPVSRSYIEQVKAFV